MTTSQRSGSPAAIDTGGWEFDHIDPALPPRLNETFAELRARCPVVHSPKHGGFWAALTYDTVRTVTSDPGLFSSAYGISIPPFHRGLPHPPADFDPPEHTAYRRVMQRHFTRRAVAGYEPMVRDLAVRRIGELVEKGHADLVTELARYVPAVAIAAILGLPPQNGHKLIALTGAMFAGAASGDPDLHERSTREFEDYLDAQIAAMSPDADTVATAILGGRFEDRPLTRDEQIGMILLLVVGGHETSAHGIGTMLYYLATVDGLREAVRRDPSLIPAMVDETLRIEAPVLGLARTAMRDTELAGQPITAGDKVLFVLNAANRDPARFERPDEFVCPRPDNSHLAFGYGVHRCAGEHLALMEMRVVAEEVLRLMPDYHLADAGADPQWLAGRMTRGLTVLPVTTRREPATEVAG